MSESHILEAACANVILSLQRTRRMRSSWHLKASATTRIWKRMPTGLITAGMRTDRSHVGTDDQLCRLGKRPGSRSTGDMHLHIRNRVSIPMDFEAAFFHDLNVRLRVFDCLHVVDLSTSLEILPHTRTEPCGRSYGVLITKKQI